MYVVRPSPSVPPISATKSRGSSEKPGRKIVTSWSVVPGTLLWACASVQEDINKHSPVRSQGDMLTENREEYEDCTGTHFDFSLRGGARMEKKTVIAKLGERDFIYGS